jgi:LmbE family N-acetylglucosaminyl deacetylase
VFAHADDEVPSGPILARYAREGVQVHVIVATDGAQGVAHTSIPAGPALAQARSEEARCAAAALGINPPILLGFPDAQLGNFLLDPARLYVLTQRVQAELQRLHPDAVLTWGPDGGTGHPDHRLVGDVITQLVRAGAPGAPEHLFYASIPVEGFKTLNPERGAPPFLVPQAKYFTVRVAFTPADLASAKRSLSCHRTQFSEEMVERLSDAMARTWNGVIPLAPFLAADAGTDLFLVR